MMQSDKNRRLLWPFGYSRIFFTSHSSWSTMSALTFEPRMALPAVSAQPICAPVDVGCGDLVLVPPPEPVRRDKDHSGWLHGLWSPSPVTAGMAHICAGGGGWGGADGSQAPPDGKRDSCRRRSGRSGRKAERKKGKCQQIYGCTFLQVRDLTWMGLVGCRLGWWGRGGRMRILIHHCEWMYT